MLSKSVGVAGDKWLLEILFEMYGKKSEFIVRRRDVPGMDWGSVVAQMKQDYVSYADVFPGAEGEDGLPQILDVRLKPNVFRDLKEAAPRRQVTIDGKSVDVRNRANFDLLNADIKDVEKVAESYLSQFKNRPTKRVRRRLTCELQRLLLLKGPLLNRELYGSICLWTGAKLPPDFFRKLPKELWNGPDPPPKRGLDLLNLLKKLVPDEARLRSILAEHNHDGYFSDLTALMEAKP